MDARILDLAFDAATVNGPSEKLLRNHHQINYSGAVKRLNAIRAQLRELPFASAPGFQLNGLKREELVATNSMLLHELYFDFLGASAPMVPAMASGSRGATGCRSCCTHPLLGDHAPMLRASARS
jgi:Fe-Mn family superoxide dismutase